jgi:plasmid stabilization system protein ParE
MPRRFPVAERESEMFGQEVRRVNHGDYAVFYFVDEGEGVVELLAFRHGRRRPWLGGDADES